MANNIPFSKDKSVLKNTREAGDCDDHNVESLKLIPMKNEVEVDGSGAFIKAESENNLNLEKSMQGVMEGVNEVAKGDTQGPHGNVNVKCEVGDEKNSLLSPPTGGHLQGEHTKDNCSLEPPAELQVESEYDSEEHVSKKQSSGLSAIQDYTTSSDSESETVDPNSGHRESKAVIDTDSSSSSSSSSDDEESGVRSSSSTSDEESETERQQSDANGVPDRKTGAVKKSSRNPQPVENPYVHDVKDLPPVPDITTLHISDGLEFLHVGTITSILDVIVTVESKPDIPAYDLDTLLFIDMEGTPLGFVDDVVGPVRAPIYVVRFNSKEDITAKKLTVGQNVYSAPKSGFTKYVFLQQLLKIRGTDASWIDDKEVPPEFQDYSDDEDEYTTRHGKRFECGKRLSSSSSSSLERYKKYEQNMNIENDVNTRIHKIRDAIVSAKRQRTARHQKSHPKLITQASSSTSFSPPVTTIAAPPVEVAAFNPAVPPPPLAAGAPRGVMPAAVIGHVFSTPYPPGPSVHPFVAPSNSPNMHPSQCGPNRLGGSVNMPWTNLNPVMMCNPMVPAAPMPNAYRLFHNTPSTFRPMTTMSPLCSSNVGNNFSAPIHPPPNFPMGPRMGVPPYVRPNRMQGNYQSMGVVGSTNMGTGNGGRYSDNTDVAQMRFVYQTDIWMPNQNQSHQWPYNMPSYVRVSIPPPNMQQPPTNLTQPPPNMQPNMAQPAMMQQPPHMRLMIPIHQSPPQMQPSMQLSTQPPIQLSAQPPVDHHRTLQNGAQHSTDVPHTKHSQLPK